MEVGSQRVAGFVRLQCGAVWTADDSRKTKFRPKADRSMHRIQPSQPLPRKPRGIMDS